MTAYSGMDAFVQAVESYTSIGANPLTDALALEAISLTAGYLYMAYNDGGNSIGRENMLLGSYMAGVALNTSRLGLVHGLAHPIGAITGAPHGLLCGLLMPAVLRFNSKCGDAINKKFLFTYHRMPFSRDLESATEEANNEEFSYAENIAQHAEYSLQKFLIPTRLSEIGLREEHLDRVVREAMVSGSTKANPRRVTEADARAVLESCL